MDRVQRDPLVSTPVLAVPGRAARPKDSAKKRNTGCPFCPGQESRTPPTLLSLPRDNDTWQVRVFENRYPIVIPNLDTDIQEICGVHEIIVETPDHDVCLDRMPVRNIALLMQAIRSRMACHSRADRIAALVAFRNQGLRGGASLAHPHTQLVGLSIIPPRLAEEAEGFLREAEKGICPLCLATTELAITECRIVAEEGSFRAFSPSVPRFPREIWIAPVHHEPSFVNLSDVELDDLSALLKQILKALSDFFDPFDYNLVFHTEPLGDSSGTFHTHIEILPRAEPLAGFEIGTGMMVNPISSSQAVADLRGLLFS